MKQQSTTTDVKAMEWWSRYTLVECIALRDKYLPGQQMITMSMAQIKTIRDKFHTEQQAKEAIEALLKGDWDNPYLDVIGALWPDTDKNIKAICAHYGVELESLEFPTTPPAGKEAKPALCDFKDASDYMVAMEKWEAKQEAIGEQPERELIAIIDTDHSRITPKWGQFLLAKLESDNHKEDASTLVYRYNRYPALVKENADLKAQLYISCSSHNEVASLFIQIKEENQQQAKDIQELKNILEIAKDDLRGIANDLPPGSYRLHSTIEKATELLDRIK